MWGDSISSRVKRVIADRVTAAQQEHDAEKERLEAEKAKAIDAHADAMVKKIIGG